MLPYTLFVHVCVLYFLEKKGFGSSFLGNFQGSRESLVYFMYLCTTLNNKAEENSAF